MSSNPNNNNQYVREQYSQFTKLLKEISHLKRIQNLLDWDQQVILPSGSGSARAEQMGALEGVIHDKKTNPTLGELINRLWSTPQLNDCLNEYEVANVRDAKRDYEINVRVPKELAQRAAQLQSEGQEIWTKAREEDNFDLFAPKLKEWVELKKQICAKIDPSKTVYDVCLDTFERGMTTERLSTIFQDLKVQLVPIIEKVKASKQIQDSFIRNSSFDVSKQARLSLQVAKDIGFDTNTGRLDVSVHPTTTPCHPTDVRITTRYKENDITEGLIGTIHETGHALYEQGYNKSMVDLPVAEPLSMGIHESQSLLWERMVGLSRPFFDYVWPVLQNSFESLKQHSPEEAYQAFNTVTPRLIRVESDELTYPLHIILRFEIERDIFLNKIEVEDLPKVWNLKMEEYLGVKVPNNKLGVLQDIHWSCGLFGYFPSYSLGAIYASIFYKKAQQQIPNLEQKISKGDFKDLKVWLNTHIHCVGSLYDCGEKLVQHVTGEGIKIETFVDYLSKKYSKIY